MQKPTLLVVDDDIGICEQLKWCLLEYQLYVAHNKKEALSLFLEHKPQVVTLDLGLPPFENTYTEGLSILEEILSKSPLTKVILLTGQDDNQIAIKAIHMGAYDFYQKPIQIAALKLIIERAFHIANLQSQSQHLNHDAPNIHKAENEDREFREGKIGIDKLIAQKDKKSSTEQSIYHLEQSHLHTQNILGENPKLKSLLSQIHKVAKTHLSVLILGESGTGKECVAKALHAHSDRCNKPFIAINCAAIPETLLESELFGYEKGAFSGANKTLVGKIELANGGTLFLDEIGDLPLSLQPKLLRFIQERSFERLGGRQTICLDVRLICATLQPIQERIEQKLFREDLFYRISEVILSIPPLRERGDDALLIATNFVQKFSKELNLTPKSLSACAKKAIADYAWPGNVRELENKIKRALIMSEEFAIKADDLQISEPIIPTWEQPITPAGSLCLKDQREKLEKEVILKAIKEARDNLSKAAELLGITRPTLYNLLEKLGLKEKI